MCRGFPSLFLITDFYFWDKHAGESLVFTPVPVKHGGRSVQQEQLCSDAPKAKVTPELLTPKASYSQIQPSGLLRGPVTLGGVASLCSKNFQLKTRSPGLFDEGSGMAISPK